MAGHETDLSALAKGKVTITPLDYNMTRRAALAEMERWQFQFTPSAWENEGDPPERLYADRAKPQKKEARGS